VIVWVLEETKKYFEQRGFRGFFCKISDEMPPENVPKYIASAKLAWRSGWRPFSTITMMIARSPELINKLGPYCDQWQLSQLVKDQFYPLIKGPNPPARLKADDELWYYAGLANPYKNSYETTAAYPLLAAAQGDKGYGFWAFRFGATENVVWYDPANPKLRVGPAFLGLCDGWQDARLFWLAVRDRKLIPLDTAVSEKPGALLKMGDETVEVYRFKNITNLGSPIAMNGVRHDLLKALAETAAK
jgi:hypothetical protein